MSRLTILLVEDHALIREGLRTLVEHLDGVTVVGEAADGREAVSLVDQLHPKLVLMDISMPEMNGLEAARRIRRDHPETRILFLSAHASEKYVYQALRIGAAGYLLKDDDRFQFADAIRAVEDGETYLSPALREVVVNDLLEQAPNEGSASPLDLLTSRQREVLQLMAEGNTTREIAEKLDVSPKTVETHRRDIRGRLEIDDLAGLVRFAVRTGLISAEV